MIKKKTSLHPALWILGLLLFVAAARDLIANERPLWCRVGGHFFCPAFRAAFSWGEARSYMGTALEAVEGQGLWHSLPASDVIFPIIPFSPGEGAGDERKQPPGAKCTHCERRFSHILGTDDRGRDVAASMVSGARIAVLLGLTAMGIAMVLGVLLGLVAGYYGDDRLWIRRGQIWAALLGLPIAWFCAFPVQVRMLNTSGGLFMSCGLFLLIALSFHVMGIWVSRLNFFSKRITLPADLIIMRIGELFSATPKLLIIVAVSAVISDDRERSTLLLLALIGAMSWPSVARFVRAELLKVREMDFIAAARALGFSNLRIMLRHALPNALRAVMIAFAFGVASTILLEASLSLLGYGATAGRAVSWGILLNNANANRECWWLILPPGLAICLTVLALNHIGEFFSDQSRNAT